MGGRIQTRSWTIKRTLTRFNSATSAVKSGGPSFALIAQLVERRFCKPGILVRGRVGAFKERKTMFRTAAEYVAGATQVEAMIPILDMADMSYRTELEDCTGDQEDLLNELIGINTVSKMLMEKQVEIFRKLAELVG